MTTSEKGYACTCNIMELSTYYWQFNLQKFANPLK